MSIREKISVTQERLIRDIMYIPCFVRDILFCWVKGVKWHPSWRLRKLPYIRVAGCRSSIAIGHHFTACSDSKYNSIGVTQKVMIRTVTHGAKIQIGHHVGMSGCTIASSKNIQIGNHVLLGSGCLIVDYDAHPIDPIDRVNGVPRAPGCSVIIEDDVWIGGRAIILKGVTIGKGSVIGAGAVIAKNIPPYSIAVGNPAKIVGDSRKDKRH